MLKSSALAAIALSGLAAGLAACEPQGKPVAKAVPATPPPAAVATPKLWRIEVLKGDQIAKTLDICADSAVQKSFTRPAPEVNGKPCVRVGEAVEKDGSYSVRCRVDDQLYRVGSVVMTGDATRAFTVEMAVTRQDLKGPTFEQVRRYSLLGACPAGWNIGDSAAPGDKTVTTLTGQVRTLEAPGG